MALPRWTPRDPPGRFRWSSRSSSGRSSIRSSPSTRVSTPRRFMRSTTCSRRRQEFLLPPTSPPQNPCPTFCAIYSQRQGSTGEPGVAREAAPPTRILSLVTRHSSRLLRPPARNRVAANHSYQPCKHGFALDLLATLARGPWSAFLHEVECGR